MIKPMKTPTAVFCVALIAGSVSAQGVYNMAKQRARNTSAQEAQHQQAIEQQTRPPVPATPPGPGQPNPALEATLQNIANLRADFEKFDASPTNTQPLIKDLTESAQGTKAKPATVTSLAENLAPVIAGNTKLRPQYQKLAQNLHAIFNSSHLSPSQQRMIFDGVQKILHDGGVSAEDTAKVVGDLKTVAAETK